MAEDEVAVTNGSAVAVAERPDARKDDAAAKKAEKDDKKRKKKKGKDQEEDTEYEIEFQTPFGKLEFEFEPTDKKEKKDAQKREKAKRDAEKRAAKVAALAEKQLAKSGEKRGHGLLIAFVIIGLLVAAVVAAYWLFARPGDEDGMVPDEFRSDAAAAADDAPRGIVARLKSALREGRKASREAQAEQQRAFEEMTSGG